MNRYDDGVISVLPAEIIVPGIGAGAVETHLVYLADDPLAVELLIFPPEGEEVEWFFSRDLLAYGVFMGQPLGVGDVRVSSFFDRSVVIELRSPSGWAFLLFDRDEMDRALKATAKVVPFGKENLPEVEIEQFVPQGVWE